MLFSLALPLTAVAVRDLSPSFVTAARGALAVLLAALALRVTRSRLPTVAERRRLVVVATGAVLGSPLLTSISLQHVTAAHAAVVCATLPAVTAVLVVLRTQERPGPVFWVLAMLGCVAAVGFAGMQHRGSFALAGADIVLLGAVVLSAIGYSEGAVVSRTLGAWQTICWGLVLAGPVLALWCLVEVVREPPRAGGPAWLSLAYLGVFGMLGAYLAWYSGLAIGPTAQVSQTQLVQPALTLGWSVLLLDESVTAGLVLTAVLIAAVSGLASTTRSTPRTAGNAPPAASA